MELRARLIVATLSLLAHCLLLCCFAGVDFIYNGFRGAANLSLDGSASVLRGGALRLTTDGNHLMGHAFFAPPVRVRLRGERDAAAAVSFSAAFVFDIVTVGRGGGAGLAFVVSTSKALPGASPGVYLGLLGRDNMGNSSNHVFAVEFDTVQAPGLFNEVNDNHVGVDLNSLESNVSEPAGYFADNGRRKVPLPLDSAQPIQAWVDYDGRAKILNVTIAPVSVASRPRRPLISQPIDLLPIFKQDMYVGFSASTGKLTLRPLVEFPHRRSCTRAALADTLEEWELDHPHRFPYRELYKATKGFKNSELLGAGGFGKVYRGVLPRSGDVVAIKRISSNGWQGMSEFVAEVASLGRMRHRNLVELRGWCKRGQDLLLVYEFMPNGSLDTHLFGPAGEPRPPLSWEQRVRIFRGVASGLVYLHEEWEQVVVHRDVKASNVLLGADMGARLGDLGLARLYEHGADPGTTRVVGTLGYMSPEVVVTGRATTATDVFAFGVLLLEVACGCRPIDPVTGVNLLRWVRELGVKGDLVHAVDERLAGCYDVKEVKLVLWLGLMCSQTRPEARPSMRQVCQYLDGEVDMQEAMVVFADDDPVDLVSLASLTWSSCATVSAGPLQGGR
ncbi:L-type lectin-domain containing receptor kinase S.4 [Dichanthelium oligosanthes]|uniref:non-specific serine/threonine protein kinase n=1 Tax=Dichanthelium oligosanthes TaxID=888268 RepID=A0A1E5VTU4_9POAL|nr:L-type lectin-domain containing receptor kinase S.4 [Dichanthelium oligosanthes]